MGAARAAVFALVTAWALGAAGLGLSGCAPSGRLILIGGGLQPDNARVLGRFVGRVGEAGPITLVATASADPAAALRDSREQLAPYAAPRAVELVDLPEPGSAPSVPAADLLRRAGGVFLTGGDQGRLTARLLAPAGAAEYAALQALLGRGGVLAGTSPGTAALSDPMFTGGDSETALARGPELGRGLGLFRYGLLDSHFFSRGRLGRLLAALLRGAARCGLGIADNRGVEVELKRDRLTALGDRAALYVTGGRPDGDGGYQGARITLLSDGDELDLRTGAVRPRGEARLQPARRSRPPPAGPAVPAPPGLEDAPPAWQRDGVLERLEALAKSGGPVAAHSPGHTLWLRADEQTGFVVAADGRLRTAVRVRVDLVPRPDPAAR